MAMFKPKTIHLGGKGFKKVFGEVEAEIVEVLWDLGPSSVRSVRDVLAKQKRELSFNAVMTIMNRLVDKGVLNKKNKDGMYCYQPVMSREDFSKTVAKDILSSVLKDATLFNAAALTDLADELDAETLKRLRKFVQ